MFRRLAILLLSLLAFAIPALAEVYEGITTAFSSEIVSSDGSGTLESLCVQVGQRVEEGQPLAVLFPEKTFASQDGTVALIQANEGDTVSGEVLELAPVERYTVYCTVDKAYQSAESTLVFSGETVYIKCTSDGTHRGLGIITQIDGEEYRVLTIGGELYVGETVYLYRDADFTAAQRVGIGTVIVSETQVYEADGEMTLLRVTEGDAVERGQLLFAIGGGEITAPTSGIVASLSCQPGDAVQKDQVVAEVVPDGGIGVEIQVDETGAGKIHVGSAVRLVFAGQEEDAAIQGTVVDVSAIASSGQYAVRIRPETDAPLSLGMSVEAWID